ncbi:hypothetical protein KC725_04005, partial [Candidatus Peregrinibacteria bacterium]|nr:hypothetical protein [Candidatus Peregrinibacteria bacterium]
ALLKTLEEPPEHVYFVLATTEVHKIPETILSRCQRFDFQRIPVKVLVDRLSFIAKEEKIEVEEKALEMIAHHAEGGLRDAIGLLEQMAADGSLTVERVSSVLGIGGFESLEQLYDFLEKNDARAALKEIDELYMKGHDLAYFNKRFLEFLREKMIDSVMGKNAALTDRILEYIDAFQKASERARLSSIPQLPLEMAAVSCCVGTAQKEVAVKDQSSPKPVPDESPAPPPMKQERAHKSIPVSDSPPKAKVELPGPESSEDSAEKKSLELDAIKQQWPRILETIKSPIARRSVQQAQPFKTDGTALILAFSTNFHLEKVMTQEHRNDIEHAIHEVTGSNMKLVGEIHEIQRPPVKKEPKEITMPPSSTNLNDVLASGVEGQGSSKDLAAEVMDMFEGEMV